MVCMAYYIYTNLTGKELRREPKGRGRPYRGAVRKEDGNWYIIEGNTPTVDPVTPNTPTVDPVTPNVTEVDL